MIVERADALLEESGLGRKTRMGMRAEDAAYIFSILRGPMYSNKPLTIIREYVSNAWDSHKEAGVDRPVQITCPSYMTPVLRIRDFGNGLSQDEVFEYFGNYGASKKRDTNEQVGMMGIGCKSAFCDCDEWNIVSIFNGVKTNYLFFIDNSNIGEISIIGEEQTDEESGIEIVITVRREDIYRYNDAIGLFCREFDPKPVILGDVHIERVVNDFNPKTILSGTVWEVRESQRGNDILKMGNIVYPINRYSVDFPSDLGNSLHKLPGQVVINAKIGDVIPVSNREALDYNKTTREFIINVYQQIFDDFKKSVDEKISNTVNFWEAKCILAKFTSTMLPSDYSIDVHGKTLTKAGFNLGKVKGILVRRKFNKKWEILDHVGANPEYKFYVSKGNVGRNSIFTRVASHSEPDENCIVIAFDNEQSYNDWIDSKEFDGANIIDLASIPYVHLRKNRARTGMEKATVYKFNGQNYNGKNKSVWEVVSDDILNSPDGGVYVPIKYGNPVFPDKIKSSDNIQFVIEVQNFLNRSGIPIETVYGLKPSEISDLHSGWVTFDQYLQNSLDSIDLDSYNKIIGQMIETNVNSLWFKIAKQLPDLFSDLKDSLYITNTSNKYTLQNVTTLQAMGFHFDTSPVAKVNDMVEEYRTKYPMLKFCEFQYINESGWDTIRDYVTKMNE